MNLFEQLSAAAAAAKALKQPDARFFACNNNGIVSAYYPQRPVRHRILYRQPRLWHVEEALRIP